MRINFSLRLASSLFVGILFSSNAFAKTYVVTCATSGLGMAIAEKLAKEKHSLILGARNSIHLEKVVKAIRDRYQISVSSFELDFESSKKVHGGITDLSHTVNRSNAKLDGIVLIGPRPSFASSEIPETSEWEKNLQETFVGPMQFIRGVRGLMNSQGSIVVISGVTSKYVMPAYLNSNVIRVMWTAGVKNLSHQLSQNKIRVNAVSPGFILTEANQKKVATRAQLAGIPLERQLQKEASLVPLGRQGEPEDVAKAVHFLLSDDSSFITGDNLVVDGGSNPAY